MHSQGLETYKPPAPLPEHHAQVLEVEQDSADPPEPEILENFIDRTEDEDQTELEMGTNTDKDDHSQAPDEEEYAFLVV